MGRGSLQSTDTIRFIGPKWNTVAKDGGVDPFLGKDDGGDYEPPKLVVMKNGVQVDERDGCVVEGTRGDETTRAFVSPQCLTSGFIPLQRDIHYNIEFVNPTGIDYDTKIGDSIIFENLSNRQIQEFTSLGGWEGESTSMTTLSSSPNSLPLETPRWTAGTDSEESKYVEISNLSATDEAREPGNYFENLEYHPNGFPSKLLFQTDDPLDLESFAYLRFIPRWFLPWIRAAGYLFGSVPAPSGHSYAEDWDIINKYSNTPYHEIFFPIKLT